MQSSALATSSGSFNVTEPPNKRAQVMNAVPAMPLTRAPEAGSSRSAASSSTTKSKLAAVRKQIENNDLPASVLLEKQRLQKLELELQEACSERSDLSSVDGVCV